tara:strand:- start:1708 stop:2205 length:498 start_codon:yes stop_codon:yes gene_type:complete
MKDQDDFIRDIEREARELEEFLNDEVPVHIEVAVEDQFLDSFENEGFTDNGLKKWEPRKTTDTRGRDITRYRTNRVGKAGELNRYGKQNQGRAILVGQQGGHLKRSLNLTKSEGKVTASFDVPYAEVHNEGSDTTPKRQFIGPTPELEQDIYRRIEPGLDKIFKK